MAGLGVPELLIILVILLLVFGPKRLPGLGRQLGGGMREFKDSITRRHDAADEDEEPEARPAPALPEATTPPASAPQAPPAEPVSAPAERDQAPPPRS